MICKRILTAAIVVLSLCASHAGTVDSDGYPIMYLRGALNNWGAQEQYRMTRDGNVYSYTITELNGAFKVGNDDWTLNLGAADTYLTDAGTFEGIPNGPNIGADNLRDVTIKFKYEGEPGVTISKTYIQVSANGHEAPDVPERGIEGLSGTLPVLYINVYTDESKTALNNEIIDRNLAHKNYFSNSEYWLDLNGCTWLEEEGAKSIGSKDEPLPLEIKARGNYTRTGFAKKPFKLKLGKKQSMLGMSKSKHYAILAHADDNCGYMRNFTGFNLGQRIGLPWTPSQQPVEVVINGDYRGLYFLTESIRIEEDRIDITELDDNVSAPELVSGGYLVELDNYDEDNQIRMEEKSCTGGYHDVLRITWDTPEEYSELQKRFVTEQFEAMNDGVGSANVSNDLWRYMDMDDAARYYLVEEIMMHTESYHGSTYLFRDHGEGQKWHFSPLWDFGNGFNGPANDFFYYHGPFGNTWIASMRCNKAFNDKVKDTWMWFMNNGFKGIYDDMTLYAQHIKAAAAADHKRWRNAPLPNSDNASAVANNSDMDARLDYTTNKLREKVEWLKSQFGDFTAMPDATEPERDITPAAPLPDYASSGISTPEITESTTDAPRYFNLQGMPVDTPSHGQIYIRVVGDHATKVLM